MARVRRFLQSPSFWPLQIAGWSAYLVMVVATFWPMMAPERSIVPLVELKVVRTLVGFALTCGLRLLLRRLTTPGGGSGAAAHRSGDAAGAHRLARPSGVLTARLGHGTVVAGGVLLSVAAGGVLWLLIMKAIFPPAFKPDAPDAHWIPAPREALDYALTLLCWSALYLGLRGWRELQDQRARALEAVALARQAQLDALRYQLNPHFLFNGLNSIRALIDEDAGRARRMITALSEFLRYPLTSPAGADVALATELDALRNYLAIEQIRFEDRLRVTFDVSPEAAAAAMPSFLLHPLVENAIKHGFSTTAGTLTLRVAAEVRDGQVQLEVSNSGHWRPTHGAADRHGTGTGLRNVQSRLAALAPQAHRFSVSEEAGQVVVRLALPYRPADDPGAGTAGIGQTLDWTSATALSPATPERPERPATSEAAEAEARAPRPAGPARSA